MTRRVVITGVGLISSVGIGTSANWDALLAGRSGVAPITHFDATAFTTRIAGEVKGFDPLQYMEKKDVKKADVPVACRVRGSLEPQALGERDCWVAAAVDEIERRSKPAEHILWRESGEQ